ncbi:MAG TPA: hypothetical protein PLV85_12660 [Polyangiaceae bacterium]|nr:hypothetical protein [Polyangiaceae bacterium]
MSQRAKGKLNRSKQQASDSLVPADPWCRPESEYRLFPQEHDDEPQEDEESLPRVVVGTLADLDVETAHPDRPIWILLEEHHDEVGVFERYPEAPMPSATIASLLSAIRQFTEKHASGLQTLLGPTDRLRMGFHTSATLEEVVESFEDDGFDVLLGIHNGQVVLPEP